MHLYITSHELLNSIRKEVRMWIVSGSETGRPGVCSVVSIHDRVSSVKYRPMPIHQSARVIYLAWWSSDGRGRRQAETDRVQLKLPRYQIDYGEIAASKYWKHSHCLVWRGIYKLWIRTESRIETDLIESIGVWPCCMLRKVFLLVSGVRVVTLCIFSGAQNDTKSDCSRAVIGLRLRFAYVVF